LPFQALPHAHVPQTAHPIRVSDLFQVDQEAGASDCAS